jgi:hypothetical protein
LSTSTRKTGLVTSLAGAASARQSYCCRVMGGGRRRWGMASRDELGFASDCLWMLSFARWLRDTRGISCMCAGFIYRCLISATVPGVSSRFDPCLDFGYRTNTKSDSKCLRLVSCHLHISISFLVPVPARDPILVPHVVSQHVPALPSHFRARRAPHDPARDLRL